MKNEHTKGPWSVAPCACDEIIKGADGKTVADCNRAEDAARIVAAVNACDGITTEALSLGFASVAGGALLQLTDELAQVRAENERLRAALRFYANKEAWREVETGIGMQPGLAVDHGAKARDALGGAK